ncbi:fluoride efflux transporter CrcB [bacterium]|nr:fluoride efflux transporter CrcB [bacterium]
MIKILLLALGGSLGTLARYGLSSFVNQVHGGPFPMGTLLVNITGCFVIGFLMELFQSKQVGTAELRGFATIGFLGAFTTFSTFSYETSSLFRVGHWRTGTANLAASVILGLAAVELGAATARALR